MDEEKYQKELFEFEQPKRSFSKLSEMLPKADLEGRMTMTFTMEKIVFISIGIVMAMVVVYALGAESGKARPKPVAQAVKGASPAKIEPVQARAARPAAVQAIAQSRGGAAGQKNMLSTAQIVTAASQAKATEPAPRRATVTDASKPYSILVATFRNKDSANATVSLLRKKALEAFMVYNEPYHRVYVGLYADRSNSQATKDLAAVKRIYKDAFIKLR